MHVWNVLHRARSKYRTQKLCKKLPSVHHRTTLSGYISATKAHINNRKKNLLNSNISACPHNKVNFGPLLVMVPELRMTLSNVHNWQHCAQCKAPVFQLLRGQFWGFLPRRGNMLHRWGRNLAWRTELGIFCPLLHAKFCPINAAIMIYDSKTQIFYWDLTKIQNINVSLARFSQNLQSLYPISGCVRC